MVSILDKASDSVGDGCCSSVWSLNNRPTDAGDRFENRVSASRSGEDCDGPCASKGIAVAVDTVDINDEKSDRQKIESGDRDLEGGSSPQHLEFEDGDNDDNQMTGDNEHNSNIDGCDGSRWGFLKRKPRDTPTAGAAQGEVAKATDDCDICCAAAQNDSAGLCSLGDDILGNEIFSRLTNSADRLSLILVSRCGLSGFRRSAYRSIRTNVFDVLINGPKAVEWARTNLLHFPWSSQVYVCAALCGRSDVLEFLQSRNCPFNRQIQAPVVCLRYSPFSNDLGDFINQSQAKTPSFLLRAACRSGDAGCIKWVLQKGVYHREFLDLLLPLESRRLDVDTFCAALGAKSPKKLFSSSAFNSAATLLVRYAIAANDSQVLEHIRAANPELLQQRGIGLPAYAAYGGHTTESLRLSELPTDIHDEYVLYCKAIEGGHEHLLRHLLTNGSSLSSGRVVLLSSILLDAAQAGQINMIEYIHSIDCSVRIPSRCYERAAYFGHMAMIRWLEAHGCRLTNNIRHDILVRAVQGKSIEVVRWALSSQRELGQRQQRTPDNNDDVSSTIDNDHMGEIRIDIVDNLAQNGNSSAVGSLYLTPNLYQEAIFIGFEEIFEEFPPGPDVLNDREREALIIFAAQHGLLIPIIVLINSSVRGCYLRKNENNDSNKRCTGTSNGAALNADRFHRNDGDAAGGLEDTIIEMHSLSARQIGAEVDKSNSSSRFWTQGDSGSSDGADKRGGNSHFNIVANVSEQRLHEYIRLAHKAAYWTKQWHIVEWCGGRRPNRTQRVLYQIVRVIFGVVIHSIFVVSILLFAIVMIIVVLCTMLANHIRTVMRFNR